MDNRKPSIAAASNAAQLQLPFACEFTPRADPQTVRRPRKEATARAPSDPATTDHARERTARTPRDTMADMSKAGCALGDAHPAAPAPSEHRPLSISVPPGKDLAMVRRLSEQILANSESTTILDKTLADEIARGTVFSDYIWEGMMGALECYTEDTARELATDAGACDPIESQLPSERQLRGRTQIAHLDDMAKHLKIYNLSQSARNAGITLFDTRRLNMLKAALAALKVNRDD